MFKNLKNLKDLREGMKTIKELQSKIEGMDMNDPKSMLESMGIDFEEMENTFVNYKPDQQKIKVSYSKSNESAKTPEYAYPTDSGFDLYSTEEVYIDSLDRKLIPTGLHFDIPENYEIQVRSKSGLALKQGLMVLNSPGTIDQGYTGELQVIIFNTSKETVKIEKGQKIAQAVISPVLSGKWVNLVKVEDLKEKDRNDNGFGSTGL